MGRQIPSVSSESLFARLTAVLVDYLYAGVDR
jgi:hypothetical protein